MNDLISRQAAIDALDKRFDSIPMEQTSEILMLRKDLRELPPANNSEKSNSSDTISRQAAIDYFVLNVGFHDEDGYPIEDTDELRKIWTEYFDGIPSAQPDIVMCKDCKHHWTHKCMDSMPVERCDLEQTFYDAKHDFCSLAERREVTT